MFLHEPAGVIGTIKDLSDSVLLFLCGFLKKLGPVMFAENAIKVWIVSHDFDNDHVSGAWLVEDGEEGVIVDAAGDPACKVLSVFW
jgi:hypothetical protein